MSCQQSRRVPAPHEHLHALESAVGEVAEHSFFAFAEPCSRDDFSQMIAPQDDQDAGGSIPVVPPWLRASVSFSGAFGGRMDLALPESLARELLGAFIGEPDPGAIADLDLLDGTGEFANMTCGDWLTRSCWRRRFDLTRPDVRRMADDWQPAVATDASDPWQVFARVNDQPVALRLMFVEAS